jgi:hypothetical protein
LVEEPLVVELSAGNPGGPGGPGGGVIGMPGAFGGELMGRPGAFGMGVVESPGGPGVTGAPWTWAQADPAETSMSAIDAKRIRFMR